MPDPFEDASAARLFVFSHPNHEGAVLGMLQRLRPHLVFLTDGGGERRVNETRAALARIGLLERAHFLDCTETSYYTALLDRRSDFFLEQAKRVRAVVESVRPALVFCDAAELYNPVHDVSLPMLRAALAGASHADVFEVPLIFQEPAADERYRIQRLPDAEASRARALRLSADELAVKLDCRERIYHQLRAQLPQIATLDAEHLGREVVAVARQGLPEPGPGRVLRYEWRGARLRDAGLVERVITWRDHYRPTMSPLLAA